MKDSDEFSIEISQKDISMYDNQCEKYMLPDGSRLLILEEISKGN